MRRSRFKDEEEAWLDWAQNVCYSERVCNLLVEAVAAREEHPFGCNTQVTLNWQRDLEMLAGKYESARMTPTEARTLADKLRRAAACAADGTLIRESVFLELEDFSELSVVTCRDSREFRLCCGDGGHYQATIGEILQLDAPQAERLAQALEAGATAIETQMRNERETAPTAA